MVDRYPVTTRNPGGGGFRMLRPVSGKTWTDRRMRSTDTDLRGNISPFTLGVLICRTNQEMRFDDTGLSIADQVIYDSVSGANGMQLRRAQPSGAVFRGPGNIRATVRNVHNWEELDTPMVERGGNNGPNAGYNATFSGGFNRAGLELLIIGADNDTYPDDRFNINGRDHLSGGSADGPGYWTLTSIADANWTPGDNFSIIVGGQQYQFFPDTSVDSPANVSADFIAVSVPMGNAVSAGQTATRIARAIVDSGCPVNVRHTGTGLQIWAKSPVQQQRGNSGGSAMTMSESVADGGFTVVETVSSKFQSWPDTAALGAASADLMALVNGTLPSEDYLVGCFLHTESLDTDECQLLRMEIEAAQQIPVTPSLGGPVLDHIWNVSDFNVGSMNGQAATWESVGAVGGKDWTRTGTGSDNDLEVIEGPVPFSAR